MRDCRRCSEVGTAGRLRVGKYAPRGLLASLERPNSSSDRSYARRDLGGVWNLIIGVRTFGNVKTDLPVASKLLNARLSLGCRSATSYTS